MKIPLSFGKIEIKYFLMIGIAVAFNYLKKLYSLYNDEKKHILEKYILDDDTDGHFTENKLLKTSVKYVGFSLMIFGDIIIKIISSRKLKIYDKNLLLSKKYNLTKKDSKYLIKKKDILFIILISLANLSDEFLAILIKTLTKTSISVDELFNSLKFFFLFWASSYAFKVHYYKHQYISIIIIISLEIFNKNNK